MSRVIGVAAAAGCAALMLAGCATASTATPNSQKTYQGPKPTGPVLPRPGSPVRQSSRASERIPASARVVTLSGSSGMVASVKPPAPVTITSAATVQRLAALVNGLPPYPAGLRSCPAAFGRSVQLEFAGARGGPALAVVTVPSSGCESVHVTVDGKLQPGLDGSKGAAGKALSIAGVNWPGYGAPAAHLPGGSVNPGGIMQTPVR